MDSMSARNRKQAALDANEYIAQGSLQVPLWFLPWADYIKQVRTSRNWRGAVCALAILSILIAVAGIIVAGFAIGYAQQHSSSDSYVVSGPIACSSFSSFAHYLDGSGPLAMTLPHDLSSCRSRLIRIFSRTAQSHTITIQTGTLGTTWDGVNTVATFGGAIGDGLVVEILDTNQLSVISSKNVAFS